MSIVQKAVETVAKLLPDRPADPLMRAHRVIGRAIDRVDGPQKVSGTAQFTAEVPLAGLAHGALVCSTIARGTIVAIDLAAARAAPGVLVIMTHHNAPKMRIAPQLMELKGASFSRLPVLQDDQVRWNGEPVAIVVAETALQAEHAASLVQVTVQAADARVKFDPGNADVHHPDHVQNQPPELKKGNADKALAAAAYAVDDVYDTPWHDHCAMELHATTAQWHDDARLTVHDATQAVSLTQATLAHVFGLKAADIRVVSRFVGGAFGNKMMWNHQLLCVAAARLAQRPVRLVLSRAGVFRTTGGRTVSQQRVALGANADGPLASLIHTGVTTTGMATRDGANGFAEQFSFPARHLYAMQAYHIEQRVQQLDTVANASMRAPGESIGSFALESALDALAAKLRQDPLALRLRLEPETDPTHGNAFSSRHLVQALQQGADRFGWANRLAAPRSRRDGEWWIGCGMATATYPYVRFPGAKASVCLHRDGTAIVRTAGQEMGMGTATVQAQHAAERLGLGIENVRFELGDSDFPNGAVAGGSAQTVSIVAAVSAAVDALFTSLLRLAGNASPLAGAALDDIVARDGGLYRRDNGEGESFASIIDRAGVAEVAGDGEGPMPLEAMKHSMHSFGAQFCEVRVNDVTGEVRVARWLGVFDCGRIINPKTAASQFRGGIVMGIGAALSEETLYDQRQGRIINPSLAEYHVAVHADVPDIDVQWLDIPDPMAPLGARGVGEIGIVGVAAAIANAVYNATGKRIRSLPITPDKVLAAPAEA
jgi:xanthine dehydrogenase YagR molybdenum-binding subunit